MQIPNLVTANWHIAMMFINFMFAYIIMMTVCLLHTRLGVGSSKEIVWTARGSDSVHQGG